MIVDDVEEMLNGLDRKILQSKNKITNDANRLNQQFANLSFCDNKLDYLNDLLNSVRASLLGKAKNDFSRSLEDLKKLFIEELEILRDGMPLSMNIDKYTRYLLSKFKLNRLKFKDATRSRFINYSNSLIYGMLIYENDFRIQEKITYLNLYNEHKLIRLKDACRKFKSKFVDNLQMEDKLSYVYEMRNEIFLAGIIYKEEASSKEKIRIAHIDLIPIDSRRLFFLIEFDETTSQSSTRKKDRLKLKIGICSLFTLEVFMSRVFYLDKCEIQEQAFVNFVSANENYFCVSYLKRYNQKVIFYLFDTATFQLKHKKYFNTVLPNTTMFSKTEIDQIDEICHMNVYGEIACVANYKNFLFVYDSNLKKIQSFDFTKKESKNYIPMFGGKVFSITKEYIYVLCFGLITKSIGIVCRKSNELIILINFDELDLKSINWIVIEENNGGIVSLDYSANMINYFLFVIKPAERAEGKQKLGNGDFLRIQNRLDYLNYFQCLSLASHNNLYFFNTGAFELNMI